MNTLPTRLHPLVAALAAALLSGSALAATISINATADTTADDGVCTLREAITAANTDTASGAAAGECAAGSGSDTINFAIGSGAVTISPASALPTITTPIQIDGYSQPGSSANALAVGSDAVINVRLDGAGAGGGVHGLAFDAGSDNSSVRGLAITGFSGSGILLDGGGGAGATGYTIAGNFIGTNSVGADLHNGGSGVFVYNNVTNSTIGGPNPADRNMIAYNSNAGVLIGNSGTSGNRVRNNYIGIDPAGTGQRHNGTYGIDLNTASNTSILDNVIGGSSGGIAVRGATVNTTITGNKLGLGADGSANIAGGGSGNGISIYSGPAGGATGTQIGGTAAGQGNVIANWGSAGIVIDRVNSGYALSVANPIRGNSIYNNTGGLGIDLADTATGSNVGTVNANDAGDADAGANDFQNYPVASAATTDGVATTVNFTLNGTAASDFRVEFFSSPTCDVSGHGEGRVFLGATTYSTDGGGNLSAMIPNLPATTVGHFITLTATGVNSENTSEFSTCQAITAAVAPLVVAQPIPALSEAGLALMSLMLALVGGLARRFGATRSS